MDAKLSGRWGESKAAEFLKNKGYSIIGMNYRSRFGEIDLIASRGGMLVFAEVKLRRSANFAQAREFVDRHKIERLRTTAQLWLSQNRTELQPRFDVIEIYAPEGSEGAVTVNHIENAF